MDALMVFLMTIGVFALLVMAGCALYVVMLITKTLAWGRRNTRLIRGMWNSFWWGWRRANRLR